MPAIYEIDDLMEKIRPIIEAAVRRGHDMAAKEHEETRRKLLETLGVSQEHASDSGHSRRQSRKRKVTGKARAPKGLVADVVEKVFQDGLTTKEVESLAIELDDRVNASTVYNVLWNRKDAYELRDGKWFRRVAGEVAAPVAAQAAAPASVPPTVNATTTPAPAPAAAQPPGQSPNPSPPAPILGAIPTPATQATPAAAPVSPQGEAGGQPTPGPQVAVTPSGETVGAVSEVGGT